MPTKKYKQKLMKHRICQVARAICCASFLVLAIIGVSSLAKAMTLENIANEHGIPSAWEVASLGNPETITIPITYWDQRQDACNDPDRQFEWSLCQYYAKGIIQGVVKDRLGTDGLPVPAHNNTADAWAAYHDIFTANIIGHDPVQPTDNFYRWFHEVSDASGKQLSKQYNREVTFHRSGNNTYEYGSKGTFPLDDVDFSKDDSATDTGHNFHFTAHMTIPMKIAADGSEQFWFSGDDDVWVFLNGQLVLDLGGLHMDTEGSFSINADGDVVATVNNVADQDCRQQIPKPVWSGGYNNAVEACPRAPKTKVIQTNFQPGDVVNLDFFYAERSTSESNTRITITNMNWPISADSVVNGKIVGTIENTGNNLVEYISSVTNRDPGSDLTLQRLASYINDQANTTNEDGQTQTTSHSGFLPLDSTTLWYSRTPDDVDSWQPVEISAPQNSETGFTLHNPITLGPNGSATDTIYFRFFAETAGDTGIISNVTSYYTEIDGVSGVTYDDTSTPYTANRPVEEKYHVSIKYLYEDGTPAAEPYEEDHKPGDEFAIPSPDVENHTPTIGTVTGTVTDGDLEYIVYYKPKEEEPDPTPDTYKVIIHYVYEDGTPAADDHIEELQPGQEFNVTSPTIPDHTPDQATVAGLITNEDLEYIVRYKHNDPTPPVDPVDPVDPPVNPDPTPSDPTPILPPVNDFDDNLVYVPPLGEVAFVPNTGVISDVVAPIFEQYFAEVILSQGFILGILALFASSFAVYFSLRRFLILSPMANTASNSRMSSARSASSMKSSSARNRMAKANVKSTMSKSAKMSSAKMSSAKRSSKKR